MPPTKTVTINAIPDGNGDVWSEDWSGGTGSWHLDDSVLWLPSVSVLPDDGPMGSAFLRVGTAGEPRLQIHTPLRWADQSVPATWKYRVRWQGGTSWGGLGLAYTGEGAYDGATAGDVGMELSMYGQVFSPSVVLSDGAIFDIEQEWLPASKTLRIRVSKNGGAFTAWLNSTAGGVGHTGLGAAAMIYPFTSYWGGGNRDLGTVRLATTRPMFGAADFFGWMEGDFDPAKPAAFFGGTDAAQTLGGLTGMPTGLPYPLMGTRMIEFNVGGAQQDEAYGFPAGQWRWTSAKIVPAAGCRYRDLTWRAYNHSNGSNVQLRVRAANTANGYLADDLLSNAHVPNNSTGLVSLTSELPYADWNGSNPEQYFQPTEGKTQRVSLAAVPAGTEIYIDVQGSIPSYMDLVPGIFELYLPRLGGFWVSVEAPQPEALTASPALLGRLSSPPTVVSLQSALAIQAQSALLGRLASPPAVVSLGTALALQAQAAQLGILASGATVRALVAGGGEVVLRLADGSPLQVRYWDGSQWALATLKMYPFN
jgi:hypothetical protein